MTSTPPEGEKQAAAESEKSKPPPPLRPINLAAAALITGPLIYNLHLDAQPGNYHGAYVTYGLVLAVCLALGLDIDRFWPRRGG